MSRDYLPGPPPVERTRPVRVPRPGHGTVWVNGSDDASWCASWQDEDRIEDSPTGSREEALVWARRMPAARRLVFSADEDDYVPLPD